MESWTNPAEPVNITLRCEIYVCKVPDLDMTYQNTYTFANKEAQIAFFKSKAKYSYTNAGVTKYGRNWKIRLPECAENIIDCNYVVFQNTNYQTTGFKYYYGFISNIMWNNGSECEIDYVFDVFQTWLFEIKWGRSYIERTHIYSSLDTPYYTTASEPFPMYEYGGYSNFKTDQELGLIIQMAPPVTDESTGADYGGIFSQHQYFYSPYATYDDSIAVGTFIDLYVGKYGSQSIVNCYMFPRNGINGFNIRLQNYFPAITTPIYEIYDKSDGSIPRPYKRTFNFRNTGTFNGYTVVNKKLLQYPFTTLYMYNGKNIQYFPKEFFKLKTTGIFEITATYNILYPPSIRYNYEGYKQILADYKNDIFTTTVDGYPSCGTFANAYLNYLNTTGSDQYRKMGYISALQGIGGAAVAGAMVTTNPPLAIMGAGMSLEKARQGIVNQYINNMRDDYVQSHSSGIAVGGNDGNVEGANRSIMLQYGHAWYPVEILKRIDRYFTMYGYQINDVAIPNINVRSKWVYLKIGTPCNIGGSIPMGHKEEIISALQRGMTFWHGDYIGDYTQVNS